MQRVALARQDPRCRGLFGAAWSLGYIAQLALAGVDAITLMSMSGASGVLGPADGAAVRRYPASFVLERLQAPARVCSVAVSDPSQIAALALGRRFNRELLLANLTGDVVDVRLEGWSGFYDASVMDSHAWATVFTVPDAWNASRRRAHNARLRLEPYAVASLEQHG